jgi:hypothetical protein
MRRTEKLLMIAGLALFAAACAGTASDTADADAEDIVAEADMDEPVDEAADAAPKTIQQMRDESLAKIDAEACREGGGEVQMAGMMGLYRCVTPYADAGKVCRDESDCEGRCLGDDNVTDYTAAPGEQQGVCEQDDSPFGCYSIVNEGDAGAMLCVD